MSRLITIVIDALGKPTLESYLKEYRKEVELPNFNKYFELNNFLKSNNLSIIGPKRVVTSLEQESKDADSVIGHREIVGIIDLKKYDLFHNGFPDEFITALEQKIGRKIMFNQIAEGMQAIKLNHKEHIKTGAPILYSSICDPIIQIAMDENKIKIDEQYSICKNALELALEMKIFEINRTIARPYIRDENGFTRTANRKDFVIELPGKTLLDVLDVKKISIGKPADLIGKGFNLSIKDKELGYGLEHIHPKNKDTNGYNLTNILKTLENTTENAFIFANLVDTDSLYGHKRDVKGVIKCLEQIDKAIPLMIKRLDNKDIIIFTADHGMKQKEYKPGKMYGFHNREQVPFLAYSKGFNLKNLNIQPRKETLASIGYIAAQYFKCKEKYSKEILHQSY